MSYPEQHEKLALVGYNNLTKSFNFCLYKMVYLAKDSDAEYYNKFINETYSAEKLTIALEQVSRLIGGQILNIACQDYQPQGASVTMMIADEPSPTSVVSHLDKSHLCVHTYPDDAPKDNIAIFRADFELSSCGVIPPIKAVNFLINSFNPDMATLDYRVRGFTRQTSGHKIFIDHEMKSIEQFISPACLQEYECKGDNRASSQLFHIQLKRKNIGLNNHLFRINEADLTVEQQQIIREKLQKEMDDIFFSTAVEIR